VPLGQLSYACRAYMPPSRGFNIAGYAAGIGPTADVSRRATRDSVTKQTLDTARSLALAFSPDPTLLLRLPPLYHHLPNSTALAYNRHLATQRRIVRTTRHLPHATRPYARRCA